MDQPFQFKQFTIHQDRCAMKVGTDGVLLGAWVRLNPQMNAILDVGAGTGIIALALAQRSAAELIDALELDEAAYEQCTENFEASPWSDRLFCYHASFQEYAAEIEEEYDLIVANPPFYSEDVSSGNEARDLARLESSLPFEHLLVCARHLMTPTGTFATIIPYKALERFTKLASEVDFYLNRKCLVQGTPEAEIKRVLLEFSLEEKELVVENLTIERSRHDYTPEYVALVQDFYLKM